MSRSSATSGYGHWRSGSMLCCEALVHGRRRLPTSPTGNLPLRTRGCLASVSRNGTVASMSIIEGITGTTTASATSRKCASSAPCAPAAASTTTRCASSGTCLSQSRRVPSSGSTAWSIDARFSAQWREEPWRIGIDQHRAFAVDARNARRGWSTAWSCPRRPSNWPRAPSSSRPPASAGSRSVHGRARPATRRTA